MTETDRSAGRADTGGVRVAVVGGGPAGLTSALKLAQRGYQVTLYESKEVLGGNISSELDPATGLYQDVYPHLFCGWYANFWNILEVDLGRSREATFAPRWGVKVLDPPAMGAPPPADPGYIQLWNATTPGTVWENLTSGAAPFPDMFLLGYSMLDIAGHPRVGTQSDFVNKLDVNGFIYSRGYSTESVAQLQDLILKVIWSIPSTSTAATSYQDFIKHTLVFPHPQPFAWMLKGSLQQRIVQPWADRLRSLGCEIHTSRRVSKVALIADKPRLSLDDGAFADFDFVVLAVPAAVLAHLATTGEPGERLVDRAPHLSQIARAQAEPIPVVNVHLKKKLANFPDETIGLRGDSYDISIIDISQLWTGEEAMEDRTVLVVAASSADAIPSDRPDERGWMMIRRLSEYVPGINPGAHWGDESGDICWERTHYRSNEHHRLFVNDVGSLEWRPDTSYDALPGVVLAGDCCNTNVNMATVEAAVQSGLQAAQAVWRRQPLGSPIEIVGHELYNDTTLLAGKLALMPLAYGAAAWSDLIPTRRAVDNGEGPVKIPAPRDYMLILPAAFVLDWWKTFYWLLRSIAPPQAPEPAETAREGVAPGEPAPDPTAALLMAASRALETIAARLPGKDDPAVAAGMSVVSALAGHAWGAIKSAYEQRRAPLAEPDLSTPYRRRWRPKP